MATNQETFDAVVTHLRRQGRKALRGRKCAYRGDDGTKCAAGCLIPDDLYSPKLEGWSVCKSSTLDNPVPGIISGLGHDLDLVEALQGAHDTAGPDYWESRFAEIAAEHGLTYTPPVTPPEAAR